MVKAPKCECRSHTCPVEPREPKNVLCRPCAKGNHTGKPCHQYAREPMWHIAKTCATCGFPSADHPPSGQL